MLDTNPGERPVALALAAAALIAALVAAIPWRQDVRPAPLAAPAGAAGPAPSAPGAWGRA